MSLAQDVKPTPTVDAALQEEAAKLLLQGSNLSLDGDQSGALEKYDQALKLYHQAGDVAGEAKTRLYMGVAYHRLGDYEHELEEYEPALQMYRRAGDRWGEADVLRNMGFAYECLKEYTRALEMYRQWLTTERDLSKHGEAKALTSIGLVYEETGEYGQAIDYFLQAIPVWDSVGGPKDEVVGLQRKIGELYYHQGKHAEAEEAFEQALAVRRQSYVPSDEATTLTTIGEFYRTQGQYAQALEWHQRGLDIAQEYDRRDLEATVLNNIGWVYQSQSLYEEALDYFEQALAIATAEGLSAERGTILNNIGMVYGARGQLEEALHYYYDARNIAHSSGDDVGEMRAFTNIGFVYDQRGQFAAALRAHQEALHIARSIGDRITEGAILNNIGLLYSTAGDLARAEEHFRQALALARETGSREIENNLLNQLGYLFFTKKEYEKALDLFEEALSVFRQMGQREGETLVLNNIGGTYLNRGDYDRALEVFEQALVIAEELGRRPDQGAILFNIGEVYYHQNKHEEALEVFQRVLAIAREERQLPLQALVLYDIGAVYEAQGAWEEAIDSYREAIDVNEFVHALTQVEQLQASFMAQRAPSYHNLVNLLQERGYPEEAFNYAERARARAFLDQIGNQQVDFQKAADPALVKQQQVLRSQIASLQSALDDERGKPLEQQHQELLERLSREQEKARTEYADVLTHLKLDSPEYASLVSVNALTLEEVQSQVLDEHTTLIAYFVMDEQTLAWVVDREGFELVSLDIGRDDLRNQVEFLRKLIARRDFDAQTAADLYDTLFRPLKPHIHQANLVIVPHGVLHYLPFAALWAAESERYLIQDYALIYAPSASVLRFILDKRNSDEGRLLALGDPGGSLPHAAAEVEAVASLYDSIFLLGEDAKESQVYAQAGRLDLLHLAAHGVYNPFNPLFTRIELASDDAHDGNLEVHEVFGLDLTGANLVVLSACETALGEQSEGDELVGLTRAFLYAGTPAVVTTLWPIDDQASGVLMESLYHHLRDGLTNAEALRAAQLEVLAQEQWQSPYYWAAFSLTGDYRGSGKPAMVIEEAPEATATQAVVETPASTPAVRTRPTPAGASGRLCGSAALPLGWAALVLFQRRRASRRISSWKDRP